MSFETISVAVEEGVQTIMLNRPERFNAMTNTMAREGFAAFSEGRPPVFRGR